MKNIFQNFDTIILGLDEYTLLLKLKRFGKMKLNETKTVRSLVDYQFIVEELTTEDYNDGFINHSTGYYTLTERGYRYKLYTLRNFSCIAFPMVLSVISLLISIFK